MLVQPTALHDARALVIGCNPDSRSWHNWTYARSSSTRWTATVDEMGLLFCTSCALTKLLACAAVGRPDYVERIRAAHSKILKLTEQAMTLSIKGRPQSAVEILLLNDQTDTQHQTHRIVPSGLHRSAKRIPTHEAPNECAQTLRERYRTTEIHAGLGEQSHTWRAAGGLSLPSPDDLLAKVSAV